MFKKIRPEWILLLAIVAVWYMCSNKSGFREISVDGEQPDLFATEYSLECVPGPQSTAGAYTRDLSPGGYCGMQKKVRQAADYKIVDGIGGDLM